MGEIIISVMGKDGEFRSKKADIAKMTESFESMKQEVKDAFQELREDNDKADED